MAPPSIRTDEMIEEIIERVSVGQTMTAICRDDHLPTLRAIQKWRRKDAELDARMFNAELRGIMVHADIAADVQLRIANGEMECDAKQLQAMVTAANNLGHQALAKLSKLDTRYQDKQQITHTGPMIIGWKDTSAPKADDKVIPSGVLDGMLDAITAEDVKN
jgi:hypothetical protein